MKFCHRLFALACACAAAPAPAAGDFVFESGFEGEWVMGYYVGYQESLDPITDVDFSALTHLAVGNVLPLADGSLDESFDIDPINGPIFAQQAANAAHNAPTGPVKAILMIGGAGQHDGWVGAASPANRATFVANLYSALDTLGFDGLDLDWEPLNPEDEPDFLALAQALRAGRHGIILTVPVGWINANFAVPDPFYGTIAPLFNQINVMTYEMAGAYPGWLSWHGSAILGATGSTPSSVDSSVAYYLASGVPPSRLGIGIGFYGTCWTGVTAPLQSGGTVVASDNDISYHNIYFDYSPVMVGEADAATETVWFSSTTPAGPFGCNFLSYEDADTISDKGVYVQSNHLSGTIIWTIAQGHLPERPAGLQDPLLDAVKAAFLTPN